MDTGVLVGLTPVPPVRKILKLRPGSKAVDRQAQPESIRLRRRTFDWQNAAAVQNLTGPLLARSFFEVGDYSVSEIPELKVRFLVKPTKSIYACIYEYRKRGAWLDLVSRYQDGSTAIFSTSCGTGTEHRPQDMVVYAPEDSADMLYTRMLKERPERTLVGVDAGNVAKLFQDTYREQVEWRKNKETSATEPH
jgi:hypothetical protein